MSKLPTNREHKKRISMTRINQTPKERSTSCVMKRKTFKSEFTTVASFGPEVTTVPFFITASPEKGLLVESSLNKGEIVVTVELEVSTPNPNIITVRYSAKHKVKET